MHRKVSLVFRASGCCRVAVGVWVLPLLQQLLSLLQQRTLLSWVRDVSVGLEQRADVQCLAPPQISVYSPVQGKLQGATVERQRSLSCRHGGRDECSRRAEPAIESVRLCF